MFQKSSFTNHRFSIDYVAASDENSIRIVFIVVSGFRFIDWICSQALSGVRRKNDIADEENEV